MTNSRFVAALAALALALGALWSGGPPSAAAGSPEPLRIVVLGDSYTAGNGAGDYYGPGGCKRSHRNWVELYADSLRAQGRVVTVSNHACSGALVSHLLTPRTMETAQRSTARPAGVNSMAAAQAWLVDNDPCNTQANPGEEYWTYLAKGLALTLDYSCTRMLPAQNDFVDAKADLVVLAMGGNDAGFTDIVKQCFVTLTRSPQGCRTQVTLSRSRVPLIKAPLLAGLADLRRRGLRPDARIVQMGYPMLQSNNGFRLTAALQDSFEAATEVRALGRLGVDALADTIAADNLAFPGQASFLTGVPEAFAGHEPDAERGNPDAWIWQAFSTGDYMEWYHPNPSGQARLAELMAQQSGTALPKAPSAPLASPGPTTVPTFDPSPVDKPTFSTTSLPTGPVTSATAAPSIAATPSPTALPTPTITPTTTPGTDPPGADAAATASRTTVTVRRPNGRGNAWRVIVRVRTSGAAVTSGQVQLSDDSRVLGIRRITTKRPGVVVFKTRRNLSSRRLVAQYLGTATVAASQSAPVNVR